jgi:A/G-specific adenine glycosylase
MPKALTMHKTPWQFGNAVVAWQKRHGRHDLPWQNTRDPYAVWLSEIMLQQTQVSTVRDYFTRFMKRFPTVNTLAQASQAEVLALWSGLGYYSRARNLHLSAQSIMQLHSGEFPKNALALQTLPGIGRSTAAAIASLCFGEPIAILDANVKRVLTRYLGFGHDLAIASHEKLLWQHAENLLPTKHISQAMPHYTQGMMDLGATVCTPKNPQCAQCPLMNHCTAAKEGEPQRYPVKSKKLKRTSEQMWLLVAQTKKGAVWMVQRPQSGIWAGLYCLPAFEKYELLTSFIATKCKSPLQDLPEVKHVLTHRDLYLHPVALHLDSQLSLGPGRWVGRQSLHELGMPAPIRKLLSSYQVRDAVSV